MFFVIVGVLLILCNVLGVGPMGNWNWDITGDLWKFVLPFVFAAAWWAWADASGLNKRREIEKMNAKKENRRKQNLQALGMDTRARRDKKK